jgi:hypothetical protein
MLRRQTEQTTHHKIVATVGLGGEALPEPSECVRKIWSTQYKPPPGATDYSTSSLAESTG